MKIDETAKKRLYRALLSLKTEEECDAFLNDLCSVTELESMCQRMEVARLLDENNTYHRITELTGASTATISRVNRCLSRGECGYRTVIDRLKEQE